MKTAAQLENMEVEVAPVLALQLDSTCASDPQSISAAMGAAFGTLMSFVHAHGLQPIGPPRTVYPSSEMQPMHFTVAMPIASAPAASAVLGPMRVGMLPGGRALRFVHHGPYRELSQTYTRIENWLRARSGSTSGVDWSSYSPMWEEYITDPATTPEAQLVTNIFLPLGWKASA